MTQMVSIAPVYAHTGALATLVARRNARTATIRRIQGRSHVVQTASGAVDRCLVLGRLVQQLILYLRYITKLVVVEPVMQVIRAS